MKVRVVDRHNGEGAFPTFGAGEAVGDLQPCDEYAHWMSCVINGFTTFIPDSFVRDGVLARDYNPTELIADQGEILDIEEIVHGWLYGSNEKGVYGWIPAENVTSMPAVS